MFHVHRNLIHILDLNRIILFIIFLVKQIWLNYFEKRIYLLQFTSNFKILLFITNGLIPTMVMQLHTKVIDSWEPILNCLRGTVVCSEYCIPIDVLRYSLLGARWAPHYKWRYNAVTKPLNTFEKWFAKKKNLVYQKKTSKIATITSAYLSYILRKC